MKNEEFRRRIAAGEAMELTPSQLAALQAHWNTVPGLEGVRICYNKGEAIAIPAHGDVVLLKLSIPWWGSSPTGAS